VWAWRHKQGVVWRFCYDIICRPACPALESRRDENGEASTRPGLTDAGGSVFLPVDVAAACGDRRIRLPALLQIHAGIFVAWVMLSVAQPALIVTRSVALHRRLGWVGAGLATAMVVLAGWAILFALWSDSLPPFYPPALFIVRGLFAVAVFAGLVTAAILLRRHAAWHKRLMLCATIVVMAPGLERALPLPLFGSVWPFVVDGLLDLIALAGPAVDLVLRRRVHPAYIWGVGAIIAGQASVDILAPTPIARTLLRMVGAH
jgi:hypothetical protein